MRQKEKRQSPPREYEHVVAIICDLCKQSFKGGDTDDWYDDYWKLNKTTVKWEHGYTCPSGGSVEGYEFHICPPCFTDRLTPWLKEQGAEPTKTESDW